MSLTYYSECEEVENDIRRLEVGLESLQDILKDLENSPLSGNQSSLSVQLLQCRVKVEALKAKLDAGQENTKVNQYGLWAPIWPLNSDDVDKALMAIERYTASATLALTSPGL